MKHVQLQTWQPFKLEIIYNFRYFSAVYEKKNVFLLFPLLHRYFIHSEIISLMNLKVIAEVYEMRNFIF